MTEKKLTKKDKFFMLLELDEVQENPILKDFCNSEIELWNRKNSSRKVNKNSEENDFLKAEMMKAFTKEPDRLFTATEIWKTLPNWSDYSNQRISALLKQLKEEGKIKKIHQNLFTVDTNKGLKSFTYADVVTKTVVLTKFNS